MSSRAHQIIRLHKECQHNLAIQANETVFETAVRDLEADLIKEQTKVSDTAKISDVFQGGERILIRRAIDMYIAHFEAQKVLHKGNEYELRLDQGRIDTAGELSERIRLNK